MVQCFSDTILLHIQLFYGFGKIDVKAHLQLLLSWYKVVCILTQLFHKIGKIGGKTYLLPRYSTVAHLTTLQGKKNWLQGLSALMIQQSWKFNCCIESKKLESPSTLTVQRCRILNYFARSGKLVARPSNSYDTTLLYTQLLYRVGKIGGKAYLLSRYNSVTHSTALRGWKNWWQGSSTTAALMLQCCPILNCSAESGKLVVRLTYSHGKILLHTQLLCEVEKIGRLFCSHNTTLSYTQLLYKVEEID